MPRTLSEAPSTGPALSELSLSEVSLQKGHIVPAVDIALSWLANAGRTSVEDAQTVFVVVTMSVEVTNTFLADSKTNLSDIGREALDLVPGIGQSRVKIRQQ